MSAWGDSFADDILTVQGELATALAARPTAPVASLVGPVAAVAGIAVTEGIRAVARIWPAAAAVSAVIELTTSSGMNASQLRNRLLAISTGESASSFTGLPTNTGPSRTSWVLSYELLVRPANRVVLVIGVLDAQAFDTGAAS